MITADTKKLNKMEIEEIVALTPTQEGLLYHYLGNRQNGFYFQQLSLTLTGEICIRSLRKAWNFVAGTNEMLRTVFRWEKLEHPVQIVLFKNEVPILEYDFSSHTAAEQDEWIRQVREKDRGTSLPIESQPFRITVCKLGEKRAEMMVSWHHILYDGWSNAIILKEFMRAYDAFYAGVEPSKQRKTRFKEFVKWHQGQDKREQEAFWSECLKGSQDRTVLPYDLDSPFPAGKVESHILAFNSSDVSEVTDFAANREMTPASLLYSVWAILLQKYNQTRDILFGTTVSGRVPVVERVDEMVGLFINTIPLRVISPEGERAEDLIRAVDGQLKKRDPFENTPLVDIGRYRGITGKEVLFDSIVVLENYPLDDSVSHGRVLEIERYRMHETTHYALTLGIKAFGCWEIDFAYDTHRFSKGAIERIAEQYKKVLRQIIRRPEMQVSDVELLTEREQHEILCRFNHPIREYDKGVIHQVFEHQVRQTPDHTAVICEGISFSYREINERANSLARRLRDKGVKADGLVAVLLERSADFIVAMLGVLKAGGAYIPIDDSYAPERVSYILRDSAADLLLTRPKLADGIPFSGTVVFMDDETLYMGDHTDLTRVNSSDHLAYVIYTSGSTGNPKGVMAEHRNVLGYVNSFQKQFGLTPGDTVLQQASCSFDHFVEEVYPPLLNGGAIVIVNRMDVIDIDRLVRIIEDTNISVVTVQPLLLNELNKREGMAKVHTFISGGDVFKFEHFSNLARRANVYNSYGPTEATVCATYYKCGVQMVKNIPIGSPITDYRVYILDERNRLMPIGIPGEICIAGSGVARGYLNNPDLTAEKFVANPFDSGTRLYRTGDVGVWQSDGSILFLGRNDEQVKIRGYRIEPREIENALLAHKGIGEAIVLPIDDANGAKSIAAYMKLKEEVGANELREHLSNHIPHYMLPSHYYKVDEFPLTGNNKVDKRALMQWEARLHTGVRKEEPTGETERKIMQVWKEVLKLDSAGLHDNFFDIGGNSILLMQMHAQLEKQYAWGTKITDLFSQSTISKLAGWVDTMQESSHERRQTISGYQPMPSDYFSHHPQAGGMGVIRFHLQNGLPERIGQVASGHQVEGYDVLLSMYGYLFTEISGNKAARLHVLSENGEEAVPLPIDLAALRNFEQLFQTVNCKRNHPDGKETYRFQRTVTFDLEKPKDAVLPLVYKDADLNVDARILETYDIILGIEDDDGEISFNCCFNDQRLNKDKMNIFIRSYIQLLTQLSQSISIP